MGWQCYQLCDSNVRYSTNQSSGNHIAPRGQFDRGLSFVEKVQVSQPNVDFSIFDPAGIHEPLAIMFKIWAGIYINSPLLLMQACKLRIYNNATGGARYQGWANRNRQATAESTWTTVVINLPSIIYLCCWSQPNVELSMTNIRLAVTVWVMPGGPNMPPEKSTLPILVMGWGLRKMDH